MKPTVFLFDIDGTLVTTGGVGRRAFEKAFTQAFGNNKCDFRFDGMTDRAIARQGLAALGQKPNDGAIDDILELYLQLLVQEVSAADEHTYRIHAGIEEALRVLAPLENCAVGLGTGNVRRGAFVKLSRVKLDSQFPFGGFGCDHEDRVLLIREGAQRGAQRLGVSIEKCRVVVIGDTPKDISAAAAIGAESVGVGTGSFSASELSRCGASFAFADLTQSGALEALLGPSEYGKRRG